MARSKRTRKREKLLEQRKKEMFELFFMDIRVKMNSTPPPIPKPSAEKEKLHKNIFYSPTSNKFFRDNKDGTFGYPCGFYDDAHTTIIGPRPSEDVLNNCIPIDTLSILKKYATKVRITDYYYAWHVRKNSPKPSNIAEVYVQELKGKQFQIVAFKNFLTVDELFKKYGTTVMTYYHYPHMSLFSPSTVKITTQSEYYLLRVGEVVTSNYLKWITNLMKDCGKNLVNSVKHVKESVPKPITIIKI